ncbi:MAG: GntR family transcriptional regulator [Candidatus Faecousia sp.]|nr:GntR family transcriptional regulator [Clostridiales bacterium]MDY4220845.1 GntR family transcriptional regulator [Candidatus Faecousia sp.]
MFADFTDLDKSVPIPLYYQLKSILLNKIKTGVYQEGQCIPTEIQLAESLQISRSTVRQAVAELVQEGWLERKTSKGTFVCHPESSTTYIRSFEPFHQQVRRLGKTPHTELLELKVIEATAPLAKAMAISPGDKVISMFRRRFADDEPMVTIHNHLPWDICNFVIGHDFQWESLYEIMTKTAASRPVRTRTIVSAEKASSNDVNLLSIKPGAPILCFQTISYNAVGKIVDYASSHYRGDSNKFEIDARPEK